LKKVGNSYRLKIFGTEFKNSHGRFFKNNGQTVFISWTLKESLTPWLDQFLAMGRPLLLDGTESDFLFVTPKLGDRPAGKMTVEAISANVREASRLVAYNRITGEGIPGVEMFGPHALRDMAATHALKQDASYEQAGALLTDTPEMIALHYGRFSPTDRIGISQRFVDGSRSPAKPPQNADIMATVDLARVMTRRGDRMQKKAMKHRPRA
jgi:hypothetical protein